MRLFLTLSLFFLLSACAAAPTAVPTAVPAALNASTVVAATMSPAAAAPTAAQATDLPATPQATQPALNSNVILTVIKLDGSKFGFKLADLQKLPVANMTTGGKTSTGPKIMDILTAAGVIKFQQVYVIGKDGKIRLDLTQVDANTLLTVSDAGAIRLATPNIAKQFWTQGVYLLQVK